MKKHNLEAWPAGWRTVQTTPARLAGPWMSGNPVVVLQLLFAGVGDRNRFVLVGHMQMHRTKGITRLRALSRPPARLRAFYSAAAAAD